MDDPEHKAPGVYVEETSSDVRTIPGVTTSTEQKPAPGKEQSPRLELAADTEWKYVLVRRLFIFLEDSFHRATNWLVHEPKETNKRKKTE